MIQIYVKAITNISLFSGFTNLRSTADGPHCHLLQRDQRSTAIQAGTQETSGLNFSGGVKQ